MKYYLTAMGMEWNTSSASMELNIAKRPLLIKILYYQYLNKTKFTIKLELNSFH